MRQVVQISELHTHPKQVPAPTENCLPAKLVLFHSNLPVYPESPLHAGREEEVNDIVRARN